MGEKAGGAVRLTGVDAMSIDEAGSLVVERGEGRDVGLVVGRFVGLFCERFVGRLVCPLGFFTLPLPVGEEIVGIDMDIPSGDILIKRYIFSVSCEEDKQKRNVPIRKVKIVDSIPHTNKSSHS